MGTTDKQEKAKLTEPQIMIALRERYAAPEYALLPQVRNRTGFSNTVRTADAIVMSLYPSRGLDLMGFEIKVSRSDWLVEKKNPAKAEEIARFCDRWWLVVGDENIVAPGELPSTWGLLVPRKGGGLLEKVEAPKLDAAPMSRKFMASIMRSTADAQKDYVARAEISDKLDEAREAGRLSAINDGDVAALKQVARERDCLEKAIADFEDASGVKLTTWNAGNIGDAVRTVIGCGVDQALLRLRGVSETHKRLSKDIDGNLKRIEAEVADLRSRGQIKDAAP